jgi:hypothetical protein
MTSRELFDASKPAPTPPELAAAIDRFFAPPELEGVDHDLECRGKVCRLEVLQPWREKLIFNWSSFPDTTIGPMVEGLAYQSSPPITDRIRKEGLDKSMVFMRFVSPGRRKTTAFLRGILDNFGRSDKYNGCFGADRPSGTLVLRLDLPLPERRIRVSGEGGLVSTQLGQCLLKGLEAFTATIQVPSDLERGHATRGLELTD